MRTLKEASLCLFVFSALGLFADVAHAECNHYFELLGPKVGKKTEALPPIVSLSDDDRKWLRILRAEKIERATPRSEIYRRIPQRYAFNGAPFEVVERLGQGAEGVVFAVTSPMGPVGQRRSLKLYKETSGEEAHLALVRAAAAGIPSIVDKATDFDRTINAGLYRFIHGVTVEDVKYSEAPTSLIESVTKNFYDWRRLYCRDEKLAACQDFNVVLDFESGQFFLIDVK